MRPFAYKSPERIEEVFPLLGANSRAIAGGTDLLTLMKADLAAPEQLVNVKRVLPKGIALSGEGLTIGALSTLAEIETSADVRSRYAALAQAAAVAASTQVRNMASIGGNLLQRPRCWYFRNADIPCWLKGGDRCPARDGENRHHAIFGPGPCHAVHPSDLAPALIALQAEVRVRGPRGEKALPLESFFALPSESRRSETLLAEDELVVAIRLPKADGVRSVYLKAMDRASFAFALVGVAAALRFEGRRVAQARIVLSGVAPIPWRIPAAERALEGGDLSESALERAADAALQDAVPLAKNAYKIPLARTLIKRALTSVAGA
jgi:xanthine dehydrogenase YagS FAD-binding subunit